MVFCLSANRQETCKRAWNCLINPFPEQIYEDSEYKLPISNTNLIFFHYYTLALFTEKRFVYICLIYKDALDDD